MVLVQEAAHCLGEAVLRACCQDVPEISMGRPDALPGRCQGDWQRRDEHLQELRYAHSQAPESMAFAAASA
ncbi:MAG: hypothetical protein WB787_03000, partial [Candidatus Acidiferrales bacterium]